MFVQPSDAILARLMTLHPKVIDLSLDRVARLLDRLGRPQDRLPPVVHIAGTNGKGSVAAYMRAALESAGHRVHAYTSPHLVRFHERIRLAGALIAEPALADDLQRCEDANAGEPITYFEITTAAAFLAFAENPADILLLECGLGGRLDATNLVEKPAATVITPVSIDHQQFLGETLPEIAGEKAAIQKPGVPSIVGPQAPEAAAVIEAAAARAGAPLTRYGREFSIAETADGLLYAQGDRRLELPRPKLLGIHQTANAAVAVAALGRLKGFALTAGDLAAGLTNASWPARMQLLTSGPLVDMLPEGWELWLDGGHNAAAGEALAAYGAANWAGRPLWLVCGMMNNKQADAFLQPFARLAAGARCLAIPGEANAFTAAEMTETARRVGLEAVASESVADAVASIAATGSAASRVLICGSLYLAGTVLSENG
jgi:dihydrofolate synthase/folylpolyglutamate synthase